ncbi:lipoprotein [Sphingomonas sp. IC-56]|uniref:lipoprotein n=1 Tax=Sphingomonas sp. IC-56 TaxID=2898529 RepID=UPI001E48205C|nr:lipoprotein [Sphingomonas sp. IC-56]MCD2323636.1 lipoprotein [Sphingomonas sp. IC-56]
MKRLLLVAMAAALSGCGARGDLKTAEGQPLPPAPYGATATPTPADLLQPAPQTRPARSDDLIQSSERRRSDEFDLPPPN